MKKISIFILIGLVGISLFFSVLPVKADESRSIKHQFKAYTADTAVAQSKTLFRISGVATASNAVYGIYNTGTLADASDSNVATEGGEATSGDALPPIDFGDEGLDLPEGSTIVIYGCTVVLEYI